MNSRPEILVVDDDHDIVRAASIRLKLQGYTPVPAFSGEQALEKIAIQHPDVILLDVRMPGLTGLDVLRSLKSDRTTSDIPIIMVSASLVYRDESLEEGAREYLSKPCPSTKLIAAVEAALAESHAVQTHSSGSTS